MTGGNPDTLARRFEAHRAHLHGVARRMLGSASDADDAVQEAWLRLSRTGTSVDNVGGWLTTVVSRVCLDMLRARASRREHPLETTEDETVEPAALDDAERDALLADSVRLALAVVLDTLAPAERVAFVLHDLFAIPFEEIAPIVGRNPAATRQLASRARRRVREAGAPSRDRSRQHAIVDAFLAASRSGDFRALLAVLDPDVVARADEAAVQMGAQPEVRGADAVARTFAGRARAAHPALVDGDVGLVWMQAGAPRVVFVISTRGDAISAIDLVANPTRLAAIQLTLLDQDRGGTRFTP